MLEEQILATESSESLWLGYFCYQVTSGFAFPKSFLAMSSVVPRGTCRSAVGQLWAFSAHASTAHAPGTSLVSSSEDSALPLWGHSLNPRQGTKVLHASWCSPKKRDALLQGGVGAGPEPSSAPSWRLCLLGGSVTFRGSPWDGVFRTRVVISSG